MKKKKVKKQVFGVFKASPSKKFNYKQVAHKLNIHDESARGIVKQVLNELKGNQKLHQVSKGKYQLHKKQLSEHKGVVEGIVDMTKAGNAYVMSPDSDEDIFIDSELLKRALDRDRVKVFIFARQKGKKPKGKVVEIIERAQTEFVGTIDKADNFAFLVPDKQKMHIDIYIPSVEDENVKDGHKAVAEITHWPKGAKSPVGRINKVLGMPGDNDVEMTSILMDSGFKLDFPEPVKKEAEQLSGEIPDEEYEKRTDFRNIPTFTIDPEDAEDFDDALSIRKLENGNWEVGVHIADVSHYVSPDSALEEVAYDRGTSVYLVDRVIPMLPEKLSNKVCSVRPNEEKLCFSAVFELDDKAKVVNEYFDETVVKSDKRFTYDEAQERIKEEGGKFSNELSQLNHLAQTLKKKRFQQGSIAFETVEVKFNIDMEGIPLGVYLLERKEAHFLVEEFMLLANRRVARYVSKNTGDQTPFVYRVHDHPDMEQVAEFINFAGRFGYDMEVQAPHQIAEQLNELMEKVEGKPEQNILEQMAIKTMSKAFYSSVNIGHYGLGFDYYTHFTSPIRRYPDLLVHRLLKQVLAGSVKGYGDLEDRCEYASLMERSALDAERSSVDYKQVEYMQQYQGEVFEGIISGIMPWGFFVELNENKCEGAVRLDRMKDDYYELDEENFGIIGRNTDRALYLGDQVKVRVAETDLLSREIDFILVEGEND